MADLRDARIVELEELVDALRVSEKASREAAKAWRVKAAVAARVRRRLREALPGALARALWETRAYHRSVLTGRCGVAAGC